MEQADFDPHADDNAAFPIHTQGEQGHKIAATQSINFRAPLFPTQVIGRHNRQVSGEQGGA